MEKYFDCCLFFTANELSRRMDKMAEKAFENIELTPIQGLTLLLIAVNGNDRPTDLANEMAMNPSSITRFTDVLVKKGYVRRIREGRTSVLELTEKGKDSIVIVNNAWENIYEQYEALLGEDFSKELNDKIVLANSLIKNNE
jgi:DNA-binding MarR family transcriptional regulator